MFIPKLYFRFGRHTKAGQSEKSRVVWNKFLAPGIRHYAYFFITLYRFNGLYFQIWLNRF